MAKLDTHARRAFLGAADNRCRAILDMMEVVQMAKWREDYKRRFHAAEAALAQARANYESARQELICDIERAEAAE